MAKHIYWILGTALIACTAISIAMIGILVFSGSLRGSSKSIASLERQLNITLEYEDFPLNSDSNFVYTRIPRWHLRFVSSCEEDELVRWAKEREIEVVKVSHTQDSISVLVASFRGERHVYNLQYYPSSKCINVDIFTGD